jgi:hypothetical protein
MNKPDMVVVVIGPKFDVDEFVAAVDGWLVSMGQHGVQWNLHHEERDVPAMAFVVPTWSMRPSMFEPSHEVALALQVAVTA